MGMTQERCITFLYPTTTHLLAGPAVDMPKQTQTQTNRKNMPQLTEEATDDTQEKRAETCVLAGLAACLLQEVPAV